MATPIRYDSLLVRALAAELDRALRGTRLRAVRFERDALRLTIGLKASGGGRSLAFDLAPTLGWVRLLDRPPPGNIALPRGARVRRVIAPPDERILIVDLAGEADASIVIELMTNQWNALMVGPDERIVRMLRPRGGTRPFRPGLVYAPPPRSARRGATTLLPEQAWHALLEPLPPGGRARAFIADIAYASPLNARYVLGDAASREGDDALGEAYRRYAGLVAEPARPALIVGATAAQPYPHPLAEPAAQPCASLLAAFALAAEQAGVAPPPDDAALVARARAQAERLRRRGERLRAELRGAAQEAERLRADADLLLAQLQRVQRGTAEVELDDFAGGTRRIALDPAAAPAENAERMYAVARKRHRAGERLPALIERALADAAALDAWADQRERGGAGEPPLPLAAGQPTGKGRPPAPTLPYRSYTTSGGLEVRVGRSGRANDELTLMHTAPNDVWLHARDVAGAHVVLRWTDADANPPQRDLVEAAVLAALHSRSRTAGVVAVDWTRRKYVRKPRRARPGLVTLERAKTLFVEPDPAVAERLSER